MKILIVEDNPVDLESWRRLLTHGSEGRHYQFLSTELGDEGLELCRRERPDCVLLDYRLPDIDGLEFLSELGADAAPAVVMLTGQGDEAVAVEAMKLGAQDYLVKDAVTPGGLRSAVRHAVDRAALLRKIAEQRAELQRRNRQLAEANRRLERLATLDSLTGLANRRAIRALTEAELQRAARGDSPLSVALIDLDRFKAVNDTHGHLVGDRLLKLVAETVTANVRPYDRVGRWGGDEFIVVLPGAGASEAAAVARRLLDGIAASSLALPGGATLKPAASVGVAASNSNGRKPGTFEILLHTADQQLYKAKRNGGNRIHL